MVWGECGQCHGGSFGRLPLFQLNLSTSGFAQEWTTHPLMCGHGHRPVGVAKIWIRMKRPGAYCFNIDIDCYNPSCNQDPSVLVSMCDGGEVTQEIKATPCCPRPQLMLVSMQARYIPFEAAFELPVAMIYFTHDTIHQTFRNGTSIFDTAQLIISGALDTSAIPPLEVFCRDNRWYSLSNRRLQLFRQVAKVTKSSLTVAVVHKKWKAAYGSKFTTDNQGTSVEWSM